jgi:hypothetical protein
MASLYLFDPLQTIPGGPRHLRETSDQKNYQDKTFIEFNFRGVGQFYTKKAKSKIKKKLEGP